jgi:hypothetical protein
MGATAEKSPTSTSPKRRPCWRALVGLRASRPEPAAHALADLVHRHDLAQASEALNRWAATR